MKGNYEFVEEIVEDVVCRIEERFDEKMDGVLEVLREIAGILRDTQDGEAEGLDEEAGDCKGEPGFRIGADVGSADRDINSIARIFGNV